MANGMYFPWTVCDYPMAQAVEDRVVQGATDRLTKRTIPNAIQDPDRVTRENVAENYGIWIHAVMQRWQEHWSVYRKLGTKPALFIMAEKNIYADALGQYLWKTREFGFKESEVLIIHTDSAEAIRNWCERISASTGRTWRYSCVNQTVFDATYPSKMADLIP